MTKPQDAITTAYSPWAPARYRELRAFVEAVLPTSISVSPEEIAKMLENTAHLIDGLQTQLRQVYAIGLYFLNVLTWFSAGRKRFHQLSLAKRRALVARLVRTRLVPVSQLYGFMAGMALVDFYSSPRVWKELAYDPYQREHENADWIKVAHENH